MWFWPDGYVESWGSDFFVPGSNLIASEVNDPGLSRKEGVTKLWATDTGQLVGVIQGVASSGGVLHDKIATTVWSGSEASTRVLELAGDKDLGKANGAFRAFSPDGALLMTAPDPNITTVWRSRDLSKLADLPGYAIGFSPDGKFVLTGSSSTTRVWKLP